MPPFRVLATALLILAASTVCPVAATKFIPGCTLPFKPIQVKQPIDSACGMEGKFTKPADDTPEHRAQNRVKNNFCASGEPLDLTFTDFEKLQKAAENAHVAFGSRNNLPSDRTALIDLMDDGAGGKV